MIRAPRVMIVEDNENSAFYISRAFLNSGYVAETHATRDEAAQALKTFKPDLVVMDYIVPGMSAEAFLALCTMQTPPLKVIFLADTREAQTIAEQFKAEAFFTHPLIPDALVEYANKMTGQKV